MYRVPSSVDRPGGRRSTWRKLGKRFVSGSLEKFCASSISMGMDGQIMESFQWL